MFITYVFPFICLDFDFVDDISSCNLNCRWRFVSAITRARIRCVCVCAHDKNKDKHIQYLIIWRDSLFKREKCVRSLLKSIPMINNKKKKQINKWHDTNSEFITKYVNISGNCLNNLDKIRAKQILNGVIYHFIF